MNLFSQLMEKPWVPVNGGAIDLRGRRTFLMPPSKLGLRTFFAVVSVLFFLLVVAYGARMEMEDWRPSPRLWLLWLNTAMLIASSLAMQWALISAQRDDRDGMRIGIIAGGVFTVAFLIGQLWAWRQLNAMELFNISNPAISFFYIITALHALHMVGGLVAWGRTTAKMLRGVGIAKLRLSIELCTAYMHFLLLVWLVLFGLLFSGNDNLGILLTLCGIR